MNKVELVNFISSEHCVTKYEARRALNMVTDCISKLIMDGKSVDLNGFGSFEISKLNSRIGRNPNTGEKINIAASVKPIFRVSKKFKEACNQKI